MNLHSIEILGSMAGCLTTFSMIPQVVKVAKTKNVAGLSLSYFLILLSGVILWVVYGVLKDSPSLVIANIISGVLVSFVVYSILKYRR